MRGRSRKVNQMVLDIHRDGLQDKPDGYHHRINGEKVAKILFIVGDQDNELVKQTWLCPSSAMRLSKISRRFPGGACI